ncbi:LuxR C-terminal-related transcriptional regulator [Paenibacillus hamazuiensis]|uniref:LuxR C-terminal-related transcriptional regulator n=1 Tax=Paenibacillus hamazuiensis TaxID=2936508 RepID=UPI00200BBC7B|nr:response regulator transcription factor [Paenibacillus hamazuiensis]
MIRILIAEHVMLMRQGLQKMLSMESEIHIVGEALSGEQAVDMTDRLEPDVVLMNIRLPGDAIVHVKKIKALRPETAVLLMTTVTEEESIVEGLAGGATGFLSMDQPFDRVLHTIRAAAAGHFLLSPAAVAALVDRLRFAETGAFTALEGAWRSKEKSILSRKEASVAKLMREGKKNREIAEQLLISEGTVKNYVSSIYGKIGTSDRKLAIMKLQRLQKG